MGGSVIQLESKTDLNQACSDSSARMLLDGDLGIDDPVNDTALGPHRGDLQMSDEFTCFLRIILRESGESS